MDDVQVRLRRNVKILMAVRGIQTARELARRVGKGENAVSQKLAGTRGWKIDDLAALAAALEVEESDLLRHRVADVVGAVASATGTESRPEGMITDMIRCSSHGSFNKIPSSSQVRELPVHYHREGDNRESDEMGQLLTVTTWGQRRPAGSKAATRCTMPLPGNTYATASSDHGHASASA